MCCHIDSFCPTRYTERTDIAVAQCLETDLVLGMRISRSHPGLLAVLQENRCTRLTILELFKPSAPLSRTICEGIEYKSLDSLSEHSDKKARAITFEPPVAETTGERREIDVRALSTAARASWQFDEETADALSWFRSWSFDWHKDA